MHPSRLDMLAVRHAPARSVVRCYDATMPGGDVIAFDLECGHVSHMAPHFDPRGVTHRNCTACGEAQVRASAAYASEFADQSPSLADVAAARTAAFVAERRAEFAAREQASGRSAEAVLADLEAALSAELAKRPVMVAQPCQQQQAKARGPARGERRYVAVRDPETGEVHRVLTSVAAVGVAVIVFVPSNRHRQGALGGMLITHDDMRKAWVFNDSAEARTMLSRNRAPGERIIPAELVADPAPAMVPQQAQQQACAAPTIPAPAVDPAYVPFRMGCNAHIMRGGEWMSYAARQATGLEWFQIAGNASEGYRLEFGDESAVVEVSSDFRTIADAKAAARKHFGCDCARGRHW